MHAHDLGRLLSLISHEIRAPVGVMKGYLRLLEQQGTELSEQHRQAVAASLRAAERATDILGQVSYLARLQRGEVVPSLKATALQPLLRATVHAVKMPPEPIVTIHVGETPDVSLLADEDLLRAALAALTSAVARAQPVDNRVFLIAREDNHDGTRGVTVTISPMDAAGATHHDVPLDLLHGGLGIELPIAASVIEAHGGQVNERREQTRFVGIVVWLPIVMQEGGP
jgi:signal transduction histidine kinase